MSDSNKFAAYLFFWIGVCLCGIEWERVEQKPAAQEKSYSRVEDARQPSAGFNRMLYPSAAAFDKDREAFIKTICDQKYDFRKRGVECL